MKKVFLTLVGAVMALSVWAVDIPKQGFGFQIGYAQPIMRLNDYSNPTSAKDSLGNMTVLNGLKVGLVYDASYIAGFGSTMGINYTFAGGHTPWTYKDLSHMQRTATRYHAVEIFVDWQYKYEVAKESYLMVYTGPSIQCGLAMRTIESVRNEVTDEVISETYNRYQISEDPESDRDYLRLNVTWGLGAGFQYKRYFIRGGYDFGLVNPYRNRQFVHTNGSGDNLYTRGRFDQWSIKLGVYLWYHE